ncbi:methyltransferase, putative [Bodo saltans]|uniref:Methyltransferase, putative n=1 Tax=Bodo saltans TaxID=75058 RepID=A0A0S4IR04_BODSA|nr:methyltransferase, putative [Bodo saltans]|eukprot:CUF28090.1 methyltransferase, putative [Bodo saltans]
MTHTYSASRPTLAAILYCQGAGANPVVDAFLSEFGAASSDANYVAFSPEAQRTFLSTVLCYPVAVQFPLRPGFSVAVGKRYIQLCEANWRACKQNGTLTTKQTGTPDGDDDGDDLDATCGICEELYEWYADAVGGGGFVPASSSSSDPNRKANPISFRSYYLPSRSSRDERDSDENEWKKWVHIQVGAQFTNVGLSLWPSAFVLLECLRGALQPNNNNAAAAAAGDVSQLLFASSSPSLRFVELGSGVGITGVILERLARLGSIDATLVDSCVVTDYQECIVENAATNIKQSLCSFDATSSSSTAAAAAPPAFPIMCEILDWTSDAPAKAAVFSSSSSAARSIESTQNATEGTVVEQQHIDGRPTTSSSSSPSCVILAADCIYDIDVVEGLVDTIHTGLAVSLESASSTPTERITPCCIVVQTHRQESTMKYFFDRVEKLFDVVSWNVAPRGFSSSVAVSLSHHVALLCKHIAKRAPMKYFFDRVEKLFDVVSWNVAPRGFSSSESVTPPLSTTRKDIVLENLTLKALAHPLAFHDSRRNHSTSGSTDADAAAGEALAATLIGPYWVEMPTMICVHRLTPKKS